MIRPALAKPIVFWLPSVCFRMMFDFEQGNMPNNHTNNGWGAFPKNGLESNGRQAWHLTQGFFFGYPLFFVFVMRERQTTEENPDGQIGSDS